MGTTAAATGSASQLFGGAGGYRSSSKSQMDMNAFLNMFMTQLKHQDPTNPLESYELASQLAQFSSVEKLTEMNSNILHQLDYLTAISYGQMTELIGKEVIGLDDSIQLTGGEASKSSYKLDIPAETVTVHILDQGGNPVRSMSVGSRSAGSHEVEWDGRSDAGEAVPDGTYHVAVDAADVKGNPIDVTQMVTGKVHAFRIVQNNPYLVIGGSEGVKLPIGSIAEVHEAGKEMLS